jgi:hypothetical protein
MPKRKFNREEANKIWTVYTKELVESITQTEKEGLEKGLSSYEIEKLWQERTREKTEKERHRQS